MTDESATIPIRVLRHFRRRWWVWYLAALALSHLTLVVVPDNIYGLPRENQGITRVPVPTRTGEIEGRSMRLAYLEWPARGDKRAARRDAAPIVLLHGSPGDAAAFNSLGPLLARQGRRVVAPDLPGYGNSAHWVPDYGPRAQARAILSLLDELDIERAHIVGWSISGAVALNMADLDPDRVRSLTMLAAIGAQRTEGSGSYHFEHAKYALGYAALVVAPELAPHFGALGPRWMRHTFIRQFLDMDQRPLASIMRRLRAPTLILHGRDDFLVGPFAAEHHHELIPNSRLAIVRGSHFLPFLQARETATWLLAHADTVERGSFQPGETILAPEPQQSGAAGAIEAAAGWYRWRPWPVQAGLLALAGVVLGVPAAFALAGFLISGVYLDFGVATLGLVVPLAIRRARERRIWQRTVLGWLWLPLGAGLTLVVARATSGLTSKPWLDVFGAMGLIAGLALVALVSVVVRSIWTLEGRARLLGRMHRLVRQEYWPTWLRYGALVPWLVLLAIRHRGALVWTRVNPGIARGGGVVEESKAEILEALAPAGSAVLPHEVIEPRRPARVRAREARAMIEARPDLGGYPIIIKPDVAEQGRGVALVRDGDELARYLARQPRRVIAQRYHPGPGECGIFWMRHPDGPDARGLAGGIFSITRKALPEVRGDGARTIRELILIHPRHRCQAPVFLRRMRGRLGEIPAPGERVSIGHAGNHARGALFRDGADLNTPELEAAIDAIAQSFSGAGGGAFDFGRFDVRYADEAELRAGRGLAIVELNGTFSESTNIYDPAWSFVRAYGALAHQWARLFALGARRRRRGAAGLTPVQLARLLGRRLLKGRQATSARTVSPKTSGTSSGSTSMPSS